MTFEDALGSLPPELKRDIAETDAFMRSLSPLKFKRAVTGGGKINYVSAGYGISYAIALKKAQQDFGWYYLYDKQAGAWYRKPDHMEEVLDAMSASGARVFAAINECTTCKGDPCSAIPYTHNGEQKQACYGRVIMPLDGEHFKLTQQFFGCLNDMLTNP